MKRNWEYKKLTDVCSIQYGYPFESGNFTNEANGMPLIRIRDVKDGQTETYYEGPYPAEYIVHKGEYLIGMDGEFNIAPWKSDDALLNQRVCKITAKEGVFVEFLYRFLIKELKRIEDETPFVTVKHLSAKRLNQVTLPVPPLDEQQRIVAELDLLTGIIDKQNAQLKELDNLAQAIFYDMFGDPIENPKGWEVKLWGDLFDTILGKMLDAKKQNPNDTIRSYLGNTNVQWFSFDLTTLKTMTFSAKEMEKFALRKGDILLCEGGESGRCAVWEDDNSLVLFQKAIHRARVKDKALIDSHFIPFVIKLMREMGGLKNFVSKATIEHLTGEKLAQVPIILPPLALQQSFAEKIQSIEKQKESIRASIADTQKLLDYTMDKYFG